VTYTEIDNNCLGFIVASDGLWDMVTPECAGKILCLPKSARDIAADLESMARKEWSEVASLLHRSLKNTWMISLALSSNMRIFYRN
jgi:serine/threonine protein phosphatase PrpC